MKTNAKKSKKLCKNLESDKDNIINDEENIFNKICPGHIFTPSVYPKQERVIALGDLHGDLSLTLKYLRLAKVINKNGDWIGKKTFVVQVGDQLDSGREPGDSYDDDMINDIEVMKYLTELDLKANKEGGRVISLLGNHEILNVEGDIRYVSKNDLTNFNRDGDLQKAKKERIKSFKPGNEYAKLLGCTRQSAIIIGNNLFVHAGITSQFMEDYEVKDINDFYKINDCIRKWLLGMINRDNVSSLLSDYKKSIFWTRILGSLPADVDVLDEKDKLINEEICSDYIKKVLDVLKVGNMIIGHTPQFIYGTNGVNSTCNKKIWRVDIGGSKAFNKYDVSETEKSKNREAHMLEIINNEKGEKFNIIN